MGRQNQFPNRSIISYRSGSCLQAAKIIKKYKKKNFLIGKDSTQHLVRLYSCFYNVLYTEYTGIIGNVKNLNKLLSFL